MVYDPSAISSRTSAPLKFTQLINDYLCFLRGERSARVGPRTQPAEVTPRMSIWRLCDKVGGGRRRQRRQAERRVGSKSARRSNRARGFLSFLHPPAAGLNLPVSAADVRFIEQHHQSPLTNVAILRVASWRETEQTLWNDYNKFWTIDAFL